MARRIIGLDVGSEEVKSLVLEAAFRSVTAVSAKKSAVFRAKSDETGEEESEEVAPGVADREEFVRSLVKVRPEESAIGDTYVAAFPQEMVCTRPLSLPFSSPKKIDQVLRFEMEGAVPYPLDDQEMEYLFVHQGKAGAEILVSLVEEERIGPFLEVFIEASMDPRTLTASGPALSALARAMRPDRPGFRIVADLGAAATKLCFVEDGATSLVRTFARGGRHLTEVLAEALGVGAGEAEEMKLSFGLEVDFAGREVLREAVGELVGALRRAAMAYEFERGRRLEEVILCGGAAAMKGLPELFTQALGVPCAPFEWPASLLPGRDVKTGGEGPTGGAPEETGEEEGGEEGAEEGFSTPFMEGPGSPAEGEPSKSAESEAFAEGGGGEEAVWEEGEGGRERIDPLVYGPALAVALTAAEGSRNGTINFRKGAHAYRSEFKDLGERLVAPGFLLLVAAFIYLFNLSAGQTLLRERLAEAKSLRMLIYAKVTGQAASPGIPLKALLQSELAEHKKTLEVRRRTAGIDALEILKELSASIPQEISVDLDSVRIEVGRVAVRGRTTSYEDIDRLKESLSKSERFADIEFTNTTPTPDDKVKFNLAMSLEES